VDNLEKGNFLYEGQNFIAKFSTHPNLVLIFIFIYSKYL
jgi:hypothetical protein